MNILGACLVFFVFIPTPSFAFQAYICENNKYQLIACVSTDTNSAADDGKMYFEETDFVKVIDKNSGQTFRFGSILYHVSGGGDSRFQSFTHKGYAYFLKDTRILDIAFDHEGATLDGHFLKFPGVRPSNNHTNSLNLACPHNIFGYGNYFDSIDKTFKVFSCEEFEDNVFSKKYSTYYGDEREFFGKILNPLW